jgi:hypothetical protein
MGRGICQVTAAIALCGAIGASPVWAASGTRTSSFAYDAATGLLTQEVVEPNTSALRNYGDRNYGDSAQNAADAVWERRGENLCKSNIEPRLVPAMASSGTSTHRRRSDRGRRS